jgi:hypothetical protein
MKSSYLAVAVGAILLALCAGALPQSQRKTATVYLRIVNFNNGQDLGEAKVETFEREYGEVPSANFAPQFRRNAASHVPYDFYKLCARATGFWTACTELPVYQPKVWVVLGLRFGISGLTGLSDLTGIVRNKRSGQSLWVRLIGIYSGMSIDAAVDSSGQFRMSGIAPGQWVLVTLQDGRILKVLPVEMPAAAPVKVDLTGQDGP